MQLIATIHPQPGGKVTVDFQANEAAAYQTKIAENPDVFRQAQAGDTKSCQPDGSIQGRPPGTARSWELATLNGLTVTYQPDSEGPQYVFSLV